uniref:Uncharacterized protein n=1 Tax=Ditylenchus dipsaci TaxID=166011 RepID=A0A915E4N0_9BILA
MIAFNFTMILMKKDIEDPNSSEMLTQPLSHQYCCHFSIQCALHQVWAHLVFFFAGILSAVSTALVPLAASHGMPLFMAVRAFQGMGISETTRLFLLLHDQFSQMAVIITNPIAAALSESPHFGWSMFTMCMQLQARPKELEQIQRDKSQAHIQIHGYMPYKAICTNRVILVVWLNAFADIVSAIFLLTYLPTYISKVLGYGVQTTGFYSSLPALVHIPLKVICGWFSDTIKCISEVNKMRICNTIALCGSAFFFALVGLVPDDYPFISVLFMTLNYATVATNCGGFYKCGSLVSRQYVHFVIANVQFLKCFTLFISPLLVSLFVTDESSKTEWRTIFLGMSVVLFIANALFCYVVTDQPAEFTKKSIEKRLQK